MLRAFSFSGRLKVRIVTSARVSATTSSSGITYIRVQAPSSPPREPAQTGRHDGKQQQWQHYVA